MPAFGALVTICLIANPAQCEDVDVNEPVSELPVQCAMQVMEKVLPKLVEAKPLWRVKGFQCGPKHKLKRMT